MVKILIVDDNKIERESLKECIDWSSIGATVTGEANNGFTAIQLLLQDPSDILITDIKMPQMSGLELAQKAISIKPDLRVIFLTGFEEFELAKSAINLNASGYINKPVSVSELYEVLKKVIGSTLEDAIKKEKEKKLKKQLAETLPLLREKFVRDLIFGIEACDEARLDEKAEFLGVRFPQKCFMVMVVTIDDYFNAFEPLPENEKLLMVLGMSNIFKSRISSEISDCFVLTNCSYRRGYELAILVNMDASAVSSYLDGCRILDALGQNIQNDISSEYGLGITIGISGMSDKLSQLYALYEQAVQAASYKYYEGKNKILIYNDMEFRHAPPSLDIYSFEAELVKALKSGDGEAALSLVDDLIIRISSGNMRPGYVRNSLIEIISTIKRMLMDMGEQPDPVMKKLEIEGDFAAQLETIQDIRQYLIDVCSGVISHLNDVRKDIQCLRIEKVIEIMQENVESQITIDEISRKVYLTQNYLRRIFKEKTGENLLEYFTRLKMEKAKEYLAGSGLKVHEIAARIGYDSTSYFCAVFKEYANMTPREYRENLIR